MNHDVIPNSARFVNEDFSQVPLGSLFGTRIETQDSRVPDRGLVGYLTSCREWGGVGMCEGKGR